MRFVSLRSVSVLCAVSALTVGLISCAEEPAAQSSEKTASSELKTSPNSSSASPGESQSAKKSEEPEPEPSADDIDTADSYQVVVNKRRPLNPQDYAPNDLVMPDAPNVNGQPVRAEAGAALEKMFAAAAADGAGTGVIQSGYRDFETQTIIYNRIVGELGQAGADETSARPGHSEHQTGLVVDIDDQTGCVLAACFGDTPMGKWLVDNAWEYGFILRYPADKTQVTGYEYEPWHFRYVTVDVATRMHEAGVTTLEEFYDLGAAPDYGG